MSLIATSLLAFNLSGPYKIIEAGEADKIELRYHTCYEDGDKMMADGYYPAVAGTRFRIPLSGPSDSIVISMIGMAVYTNFITNNYTDSVMFYQDGNGSPDVFIITATFSLTQIPGGYLLEMTLDSALPMKPTAGDSIILWLVSPNQVSGGDSLLVGLDTTANDGYTSKINFVSEDNGPWRDIYTTYGVGNDWGFTVWYTLYGGDVNEDPINCYTTVKQIYPNPASGRATLEFSVPDRARAEVGIYDISGREVARPFAGEVEIGWHRVDLDLSGLTPGAYLVTTSTTYGTVTRTLLVK